ncbi:MAG: hypothetical protein AAGI92_10100 [Pseudomonadota bacterium]
MSDETQAASCWNITAWALGAFAVIGLALFLAGVGAGSPDIVTTQLD